MVSVPTAAARTAALPYRVRKTILSIKEIVGDHSHSDADIYSVLKECSMDPNVTAQKLLKRDHFLEVKRKTDKKQENLWNNAYSESRNLYGHTEPVAKPQDKSDRNDRIAINREFRVVRDNTVNQKVNEKSRSAAQTNFDQVAPDSSAKRFSTQISKQKRTDARSSELQVPLRGASETQKSASSYARNTRKHRPPLRGASETQKSASSYAMNTRKQLLVKEKNAIVSRPCLRLLGQRFTNSSPATASASSKFVVGVNSKSSDAVHVPSSKSRPSESIGAINRKVGGVGVRQQAAHNSLPHSVAYSSTSVAPGLKKQGAVRSGFGRTTTPSTASASSKSVIGVNSKSTDPVHVPSSNSRPSKSVDAIKRKVGDAGVRHKSAQNSLLHSAPYSSSSVAPGLRKYAVVWSVVFGRTTTVPRMNDQSNQAAANQTSTANVGHNKHFWANHRNGRIHQQATGHQKASQPNKEWKLKSSQKLNVPGLAVPGQSDLSSSLPSHNSSGTRVEASVLPEKFAQINVSSEDHVIIPQHLQLPEVEKSRFLFGSFGMELDLYNSSTPGLESFSDAHEHENEAAIKISNENASIHDNYDGGVVSIEDDVRRSGSESLGSDVFVEGNKHDKGSASPPKLNDYSEIGLVQSSRSASDHFKLQQEANNNTLPNFSEYDSQITYDMLYFKPTLDGNMRPGLPSPEEVFGLHSINGGPASLLSANLVQQQHSISQMYPQVHIPHFPNLIPYRQVNPPVYVPPMAVPGFSSNLAYHHPTNGNNYLVLPGVSSHPSPNNLKYAPSQIKGAPVGGPASYGNFTNPDVYPIGTSRNMGTTDLVDVSRIEYKDGNMFVPNLQVDTSEIWSHTPREPSNIQFAPYYNMSGQVPHAAFLPSSGPSSFINTPTVQSAHLPFPGLCHLPQFTTTSNPQPLVHPQIQATGCNLPVSRMGAYQQAQPNWATYF